MHPLAQRDQSQLIKYQSEQITHHKFTELSELLPHNSLLFLNDTKVIPARILASKVSGAKIEILLLHPVHPSTVISQVMEVNTECTWQCMIGNKKKWRSDVLSIKLRIRDSEITIRLELINLDKNYVRFSWENERISFNEIIDSIGQVPLPPYLNRQPIDADKERYQTVYSKADGAVAAPTAGLHLTQPIIEHLKTGGHAIDYLTLHVGAGTFQPIKTELIANHQMHEEQVIISKHNIEQTIRHKGPIIPVGTTSMRTLESLYWYGVKLLQDTKAVFEISKELPYETGFDNLPSIKLALDAVLSKMSEDGTDTLVGNTGIYIYPGYQFQICKGLITNFHQPKSSLILLIAALIGENWRKLYKEALDKEYRFLSYGDSSLLIP